jgi:predicted enzyme related to lactoylglutathione lyase
MAGIRTPQLQTLAEVQELVVPTTRTVPSLDDALRQLALFGGAISSETRTAPGVGSWALVTDQDGNELVLWEDARPVS